MTDRRRRHGTGLAKRHRAALLCGVAACVVFAAGAAPALQFRGPGADPFFIQGLPSFAAHSALHAALERFVAEIDAAPLPTIALGDDLLAYRAESPDVATLRAGLGLFGYPTEPGPKGPAYYDRELEAAVRAMQARFGLAVDGMIGSETRRFLRDPNAILRKKAVQSLNVMPPAKADRMIIVNIAARELRYVAGGEVVFRERVVVGRPSRPTPPMAVPLTQITFNPIWSVPPGIESLDIVPALARDATYASRKHLRVYEKVDGRNVPVDPLTVDWSTAPTQYSFVQPPGEATALGRVKFEMWNPQNIYLHDTPEKRLFVGDTRTDSSGCVRVRNIRELARVLLGDDLWLAENVDERLDGDQTFGVRLPRAVPVVLEYRLADFGEDGQIRFHRDIYDVLSPKPKAPIENDLNRMEEPGEEVPVAPVPGPSDRIVNAAPETPGQAPPAVVEAAPPTDAAPAAAPVPEPDQVVDAVPETPAEMPPAMVDAAPATDEVRPVPVGSDVVVDDAPAVPAEMPPAMVDAAPAVDGTPPTVAAPETPGPVVDAAPEAPPEPDAGEMAPAGFMTEAAFDEPNPPAAVPGGGT